MQSDSDVNILMVDDHPENLVALEAILAGAGANLLRAGSGREALKAVLQHDFAVILLDVQMPDMDGFEVATLIRARTKSRSTPIIFLTAFNTSDTHVFQGYALGAVDYLFKPFVPEVLRSKVQVFVELFRKTQEIERQLIETQRLNQELDARNRAITALHENITELATAEAALRREVLQWQQAEETLRLAMEAIGREMQAKSEFLSGVSHELRTPLTAVLGYAALLGKTELAPKQHKYVESITTAGRHLLELIDEVLDITRLEVDRLTIALEPVAVRAALEVVRYMIVPLAGQRHVQLVDGLPQDRDVYVQADPQRLKQVLLNLLSNAVKYNLAGGSVTVSCAAVPEDRVRICIADTGVGIPADKLDRLFTPFDRLGAEHSGVEGTGLGLALCKRLVEAMGGAIGVDSVVDEGSTFWIELPLADPAAPPEPVQTGAAGGAGEGG